MPDTGETKSYKAAILKAGPIGGVCLILLGAFAYVGHVAIDSGKAYLKATIEHMKLQDAAMEAQTAATNSMAQAVERLADKDEASKASIVTEVSRCCQRRR